MAAPRGRGRPAKINTQAEELQSALNFVACATGDLQYWQKHVRMSGNFVVAYNGQVSAGHPIVEDLECNPHLDRTLSGLKKCGKSLTLAQTPAGKLSIKGDKLRALVDGLPTEDMPTVTPDPGCANVSDILKDAFKICGSLASEAGDHVVKASLLLEANVCSGTNRAALVQFWHGIDLPPAMVIPKVFAAAVAKQTLKLTGLGFGWDNQRGIVSSVTLYFENGAWIKTQTYVDRWPDVNAILDVKCFPQPIPNGLFEGIAAVADFNENGWVTFADGKVQSHRSDQEGAQYDVPGLKPGLQFSGKLIGAISGFATTIDLTAVPNRAFFFGENIRGAVMGIIEHSSGPAREPEADNQDDNESEQ